MERLLKINWYFSGHAEEVINSTLAYVVQGPIIKELAYANSFINYIMLTVSHCADPRFAYVSGRFQSSR